MENGGKDGHGDDDDENSFIILWKILGSCKFNIQRIKFIGKFMEIQLNLCCFTCFCLSHLLENGSNFQSEWSWFEILILWKVFALTEKSFKIVFQLREYQKVEENYLKITWETLERPSCAFNS